LVQSGLGGRNGPLLLADLGLGLQRIGARPQQGRQAALAQRKCLLCQVECVRVEGQALLCLAQLARAGFQAVLRLLGFERQLALQLVVFGLRLLQRRQGGRLGLARPGGQKTRESSA